jgi:biofilm PGA synthesis N-glycosyltransferase PgaC
LKLKSQMKLKYVVITPAHNEEKFIEKTISSMIAQRVRPSKWVIVNDGSTDRTKEVVEKYLPQNAFIELLNVERGAERSFGNKARAFNRGVEQVRGLDYEFIGNLDADMSLEPDYYANILQIFAAEPKLGVCGGIIYTTVGDRFVTADRTLDSVAGAVQLFRRECFADIGGGYTPLPYGGIDAAAEITAKSKGWIVRKSRENKAYEHRQTGTAVSSPLTACYRLGRRFHSLGYGLAFFSLRCLYRIGDSPVFVGSCATFLGFVGSVLKRRPVLLPEEAVKHWRREQRGRLYRSLMPWVADKAES